MRFRIEAYKRTESDWCPPFCLGADSSKPKLVRVSILDLRDGYGWRVCVWGADDYGMERDFEHFKDAEEMYCDIMLWPTVEPDKLKEKAFVIA